MKRKSRLVLLVALVASTALPTFGQVATGTPSFGSFAGGPDIINLGNLNAHWDIPVRNKAGRGQDFTYDITYDNSVWYPASVNGSLTWQPIAQWGWKGLSASGQPYIAYNMTTSSGTCGQYNQGSWQSWTFSNVTYSDQHGVVHSFPTGSANYINASNVIACPPTGPNPPGTLKVFSTDGSGLALFFSVQPGSMTFNIIAKDGTAINAPVYENTTPPQGQSGSTTDRNGNQITWTNGTFTDTLGQTALGIVGTAPSNTTLSFADASGNYVTYTVSYGTYSVRTNFGCSVGEYSSSNVYLPSAISLPDGRSYQLSYEPTPGYTGYVTARVSSVKLPTGGTISYNYTGSNNGIVCSDGSTSGMTRTTPDGTWIYARSGSGTKWTTTLTAPAYNSVQDQTVIGFLTDSSNVRTNFYEIKRQMYAGAQSPGSLLQTVLHCYNPSGCDSQAGDTGAAAPSSISQIKTTTQWPDYSGISAGTLDVYDSQGNLSSHAVYDFGTSGTGLYSTNPLQTTTYGYDLLQSTSGYSSFLAEVKIADGSGATVSDTVYKYDESGVSGTTGTPQHTDATYRYNRTSAQQLVAGSTWLKSTYTYFDTGLVNTATDANGTSVTTYTYGNCGNSFLTSTSTPVKNSSGTSTATLTTGASWNCVGGVPVSTTDANGNTTSYAYITSGGTADPYWRAVSVTDPAGNVTGFTYPTNSVPNTSTTSMSFYNGSSVNKTVTTTDGLGRTILSQQAQAPNYNYYDSVAMAYDSRGRLSARTVPFTAESGATLSPPFSVPQITTSYDSLGRTSLVLDSGGGSVSYTYTANDVLVAKGPAPAGENLKQRSLEYNGAGQLVSVCEITSLGGNGACGQTTSHTGYLTKYTYNVGNLTSVQQNAQPGSTGVQVRSLSYDGLGRKLSESIPEWSAGSGNPGSGIYVYDSDSSGTCSGSSSGDLIKSIDNAGNTTCYTYDSMHRVLSTSVVSGVYTSVTPQAHFVYDAASYNGAAMQNAKGNLAEAYTCQGSCSSKLTDEFFSNSLVTSGSAAGGVLSQIWQSTPNSAGYFLTQDTRYPNGALASRTSALGASFYGYPNMSYGLDGEGRPYWASDSTRCINPVTATTYNSSGAATSVTFGNTGSGAGADVDSFEYDPNTNRPKALNYFVNGTESPFTINTTLTWNANGSLNKMAYADGNDPSKTQNCSYSADDLGRIASVNCGSSTWAQTFTYDPFGNINKSGSVSYAAGYNAATNQVSSGIVPTPQYDANGNQLTSTPANLSWNAWNVPISVNGTAATYDALGRMVEKVSGGTATQFVFSPSGTSIAMVQGGNLIKGTVPLTGGDTAIYTGTTANPYIRHTDWLGSSRLATTWAHGVQSKEAYAPFGETYNETGSADRSFTAQDQNVVAGSGGSGVYDFLFRKYDPSAGRWLSPDPLGWGAVNQADPQSLDRYAYVENQPMSLVDPNGELWCFAGVSGDNSVQVFPGFTCYSDSYGGGIINNPGDGQLLQDGAIYSNTGGTWTQTGSYWYMPDNLVPSVYYNGTSYNVGMVSSSGAPSNDPTWSQKNKDCLDKINSTPDGQFYNFMSPLSMLPGIGPEWKSSIVDNSLEIGGKYLAYKFFVGASKTMVRTPFGSMSGGVAGAMHAVVEDIVAPVAAAATVAQLTVHAGCAVAAIF